jgi:hypothetical protein
MTAAMVSVENMWWPNICQCSYCSSSTASHQSNDRDVVGEDADHFGAMLDRPISRVGITAPSAADGQPLLSDLMLADRE